MQLCLENILLLFMRLNPLYAKEALTSIHNNATVWIRLVDSETIGISSSASGITVNFTVRELLYVFCTIRRKQCLFFHLGI